MAEKVKPIPDGYEGITPYLICKNAAKAIDFIRKPLEPKSFIGWPKGKRSVTRK